MKILSFFIIVLLLAGLGCQRKPIPVGPVTPTGTKVRSEAGIAAYVKSYHYQLVGDLEAALALRRQAVAQDFWTAYLWFSLGDLAFKAAMNSQSEGEQPKLLEEAFTSAEKAVHLDPDYSDAYQLLLHISAAKGDMNAGIATARKLITLHHEDATAYLELAKLFIADHKYPEALETLEKLLSIDPNNEEGWFLKAGILMETGRASEAEEVLKRTRDLDPTNESIMLQLCNLYESGARFADAEALLKDFMAQNPEAYESRYRLGVLYFGSSRWDEAQELFLALRDKPPYRQLVTVKLAQIEFQAKHYEKALAYFDELTPTEGNKKKIEIWRAMCCERLNDLKAATEIYWQLIQDFPDDNRLYNSWSQLMIRQDRADEVLARFDTTEKSDAVKAVTYRARAYAFLLMKSDDEAQRCYQAGIVRFPKDPGLRFDLAVMLEDKGKWEEGQAMMESVLKLDPGNVEAHNFVGYSMAERNRDLNQALQHIQKALKAEPDNEAFVDSLGWVYYRMGKFDQAIEQLERAVALSGGDPVILMHLGDAYFAKGNKPQAVDSWRRSLALEDNRQVRERLEQAGAPVD